MRFTNYDLDLVYNSHGSPNKDVVYDRFCGRSQEINEYLVKHAGFDARDRDILDVGGGNGEITHWFVENSNCRGDIYEFGADRRTLRPGLNKVGNLLPSKKYDLLLFNHVLEHVNYPSDFLAQFLSCAKEGALIYIEVPFELLHYFVFHTKGHYEHINYFSCSSVLNLGTKLGLQPIHVSLRLGYGKSIPVISGVFRLDSVTEKSETGFSFFKDVLTARSVTLFVYSKIIQKLGLVDSSHRAQ
jgi:hypothetical protein